MKNKSLYASGAILLVAVGIMNTQYVESTQVPTIKTVLELPACEFEDSTNCYWDAETRGNGQGTSFVATDWDVLRYDQYTYTK